MRGARVMHVPKHNGSIKCEDGANLCEFLGRHPHQEIPEGHLL
jgi:hypothetical protein